METTSAGKQSQKAFQDALREHLAARRVERTAPGVDGIRRGLDLAAVDEVCERLDLSQDMLEQTLGVSTRTLQRRRKGGQSLTPVESDRLWRVLHVLQRALDAFGDEEAARAWLMTPKALLDAETPLQRLDTEPGLREVEDMLTVIDETAAA